IADLPRLGGREVRLEGWVLTRRDLGGVGFLLLRDRSGTVQCVVERAVLDRSGLTGLPLHESFVALEGVVAAHAKAPGGVEVHVRAVRVVSEASAPPPVELSKEEWHSN